ncbi:MAG: hypothetical protein ACLQME_02305 [Alphaproteobacteria bacterium]
MRPGAFSKTGFLGPNERLRDVIAADAKTLQKLNLTYAEIAFKLDALIAAAEASPVHRARLRALQCRVQVYQGFQICPWALGSPDAQCSAGLGVRHGSVDWWVTNLRTGEEMKGPGLVVHLIRDHHFFEGLMSPNRVDPSRLAHILDLC